MELKKDFGLNVRKAYQAGDKKSLQSLAGDLGECVKRIDEFHKEFKALWMKENKPFGWEIQDIRLGGLRTRFLTCQETIEDYLSGKTDKIPELEEKILDKPLEYMHYVANISPSML